VEEPEGGNYKEQDTIEAIQLEKQIEIIPRFTSALARLGLSLISFL